MDSILFVDIAAMVSVKSLAESAGEPGTEFIFGSKADTLLQLQAREHRFVLLPLEVVNYTDWQYNRKGLLRRLSESRTFSFPMAVRSSAAKEDTTTASHAGEFLSVLKVASEPALAKAIDDVFASYKDPIAEDQVLIQPMAEGIVMSGVAMSRDGRTGSPYVIINYVESSDTAAVTSGHGRARSCTYLSRYSHWLPEKLAPVAAALEEILSIVGGRAVDVEFGVSHGGQVTIFQVRPIVLSRDLNSDWRGAEAELEEALRQTEASIRDVVRFNESRGLKGAIFGIMPDWNPAELIGVKPRPLAYSLYRHLITDNAWSAARAELGYRDLRSVPLMHSFGGTPYISVIASMASFLPAGLEGRIGDLVISDACSNLLRRPELHDKIEFTIIPTCSTPIIDTQVWRSRFPTLSDEDWRTYSKALLTLTNDIVCEGGGFARMAARVPEMERLFAQRVDLNNGSLLDVASLFEAVRAFGTPLFAGVARAAFIATDIINALTIKGCLRRDYLQKVTQDAETIGSRIIADFVALAPSEFLIRHGHIRPGTYDISVPRYDDPSATYFSNTRTRAAASVMNKHDDLSPDEVVLVEQALVEAGYIFSWQRLRTFATEAIHAREYVKYLFSAFVSDALEVLCVLGVRHGIDRASLSFATFGEIANAPDLASGERLAFYLRDIIQRNRKVWEANQKLRLPDLITRPEDIYCFESPAPSPNFVSDRIVEAETATVTDSDLSNKIVFIESADPGYDWLFAHPIAGFVTKFGGENSHMSIRAREFNLPAVIGAGHRFDSWSMARHLRIECGSKRVDVIA